MADQKNPSAGSGQATSNEDSSELPEVVELKKQLEELQEESNKHLEGWKRAQADYQNAQKNASRDREQFEKMTMISLLTQFFPLHRNLSLALTHTPEDYKGNEWVQGIEQIYKQSEALLAEFGVEQIQTDGAHFDPELHEALSQEQHADKQSGDIVREVSPGYTLNGDTIVPAQVIVAE